MGAHILLLLTLFLTTDFPLFVALVRRFGPFWRATSFLCLRAGPFPGVYWPACAFPCGGIGGNPGGCAGWAKAATWLLRTEIWPLMMSMLFTWATGWA